MDHSSAPDLSRSSCLRTVLLVLSGLYLLGYIIRGLFFEWVGFWRYTCDFLLWGVYGVGVLVLVVICLIVVLIIVSYINYWQHKRKFGYVYKGKAALKMGDLEKARKYFRKVKSLGGTLSFDVETLRRYVNIAQEHLNAGRLDEAIHVVKVEWKSPYHLVRFIEQMLRKEDLTSALYIAREIEEDDSGSNSNAMAIIAVYIAKAGQRKRALEIFKDLLLHGNPKIYPKIIRRMISAGFDKEVGPAIDKTDFDCQRDEDLARLFWAQDVAAKGQAKRATQIARKIKLLRMFINAFRAIGIALAKHGEHREASESFAIALEAALECPMPYARFLFARSVAAAWMKSVPCRNEVVRGLFAMLFDELTKIENKKQRLAALNMIRRLKLKTGHKGSETDPFALY